MVQIEYVSQRKEVWDWYWRAWRLRLWKTHAVVLVVMFINFVYGGSHTSILSGAIRSMAIAVILVSLSALFPQIMFKPQLRIISLDMSGLHTAIGGKSATRSWQDVKSIDEWRGCIVISLNSGNAFIVPPRAFASPDGHAAFLSFARSFFTPAPPLVHRSPGGTAV